MKTILIILAIVAILAAGIVFFSVNSKVPETQNQNGNENKGNNQIPLSDNQGTPKTYDIKIENFEFIPGTLVIKKGESVTWANLDNARHTVTSDSGNELDSRLLPKGESYSHTFNTAGTFDYHCQPHPYMKAKIIVE